MAKCVRNFIVELPDGRRVSISADDISSAAGPGESAVAELAFTEAGYTPPEGRRVLYFRVGREKTAQFEGAVEAGRLNVDELRGFVGEVDHPLNVMPTPDDGQSVLYSIELPSERLPRVGYTTEARRWLGALGGKKFDQNALARSGYRAPVALPNVEGALEGARISRVPDQLTSVLKSPAELGTMTKEEVTQYARRALIFDTDLNAETARAVRKVRRLKARSIKASREGDHAGAMDAADEATVANLDVAAESTRAKQEVMEQMKDEVYPALHDEMRAQFAGEAPPGFVLSRTRSLDDLTKGDLIRFTWRGKPRDGRIIGYTAGRGKGAKRRHPGFRVQLVDKPEATAAVTRGKVLGVLEPARTPVAGDEVTFLAGKKKLRGLVLEVAEKDQYGAPSKLRVDQGGGDIGEVSLDRVVDMEYTGKVRQQVSPILEARAQHATAQAEMRDLPGDNPTLWGDILEDLPEYRMQDSRLGVQGEIPNVQARLSHPEREGVEMTITRRALPAAEREYPPAYVMGDKPNTYLVSAETGDPFVSVKDYEGATKRGIRSRSVEAPIRRDPVSGTPRVGSEPGWEVEIFNDDGQSWRTIFSGEAVSPASTKRQTVVLNAKEQVIDFIRRGPFVRSNLRYFVGNHYVDVADPRHAATMSRHVTKNRPLGVTVKRYREVAGKNKFVGEWAFDTDTEAHQFLESIGMKIPGDARESSGRLFAQVQAAVPDPATATPAALEEWHSKLTDAVDQILLERNGMLPSTVREYLYEFGDAYAALEHGTPFNFRIRDSIAVAVPEDLSPGPYFYDFDGKRMGEVTKLGAGRGGPSYTARRGTSDATGVWNEADRTFPVRTWIQTGKVLTEEQIDEWRGLLLREIVLDNSALTTAKTAAAPHQPGPSAGALADSQWLADKETGQIYRLVSADGPNFRVADVDGQEFKIASDAVEHIRGTKADLYWRKQRAVMNGEGFPLGEAPAIGLGEVEAELGLTGIRNIDVIRNAMRKQILTEFEGWTRTRGGGFRVNKDQAERMTRYWRRAMELGIDPMPESMTREGKVASRGLQRAFRRAVVESVKEEWGGHPIGDLIGRALVGDLSQGTLDDLSRWAGEYGLANMMPHKQVEELVRRGALDPHAAQLVFQLKTELGIANWMAELPTQLHMGVGSLPTPVQRVQVNRYRLPHDINELQAYFGIPRKVAQRHPTMRAIDSAIYEANGRHNEYLREFFDLEKELRMRYSKAQLREIVDLIERPGTWADMGAAEELQFGYTALKDHLSRRRYDTIWAQLKRGMQGRGLKLTEAGLIDAKDVALLNEIQPGLAAELQADPERLGVFTMMDRVRSRTGAWDDSRIDEFIRVLKQHATVDDYIAAAGKNVRDEYIDQFTFWKNYGIDNYWPYVHEGQYVLERHLADGTKQIVGYAPSPAEALQTIRWAKANGRLPADAEIGWREMAPMFDDQLATVLRGKKYQMLVSALSSATGADPVEVNAMIARTGALAPGAKAPWSAHFEKRAMALKPLKDEDPLLSLLVYNTRLARARYRHEVLVARDAFLDSSMDRALASAAGVEPLGNLRNFRQYADDYINAVLGERTTLDRKLDAVLGFFNMVAHAPKAVVRELMGRGEGIPISTLLDWRFHHRAYQGRYAASQIVALQSQLKLAFSPTSAAVNLSQLATNTAPIIGERYLYRGMKEAYKHSKGTLSASEAEIVEDIFRVSGVRFQTGRHMAGDVGLDWVRSSIKPGKGAGFAQWARYYSMYMFDGAEQVNRRVTALGGYHYAREVKGMEHAAAARYARRLVAETQFYYESFAQPMFMQGSVQRVLFQFKPFLVNQLSFEKDLLRTAMGKGTPLMGMTQGEAFKALLRHGGYYLALGGMRGALNHPFLLPITAATAIFGYPAVDDLFMAGQRHEKSASTKGIYQGSQGIISSSQYIARDVATHGLPALLGLSLGERIGISSGELELGSFGRGPHVDMLLDYFAGVKEYMRAGKPQGTLLPLTTGLAAQSLLARQGLPRSWGFMVGTALTSQAGHILNLAGGNMGLSHTANRWSDFAMIGPGKRAAQTVYPVFYRNLMRSLDLMVGHELVDFRNRPVTQTGASRAHTVLAALASAQTTDMAEIRALTSILLAGGEQNRLNRSIYADNMAMALMNGDWDLYYRLAAQAAREGISFSYGDMQDRVERMDRPVYESVRRSQPVSGRWPNYNR
jgi:hypothetical protein